MLALEGRLLVSGKNLAHLPVLHETFSYLLSAPIADAGPMKGGLS